MSITAGNVARVRKRIRVAAEKAGRDPDEVVLVAVSKRVAVARIREAIAAGVTVFGENYVQEARDKFAEISEPVSWHMIGHVQTNKVKYIVPHCDVIHSVDSFKLAQEISKRSEQHGMITNIFVQVNLAQEETKSGVDPEDVMPLIDKIALLQGVRVTGLMTMPPFFDDPEAARPFFGQLRRLRDKLAPLVPSSVTLTHLSMGMSGDLKRLSKKVPPWFAWERHFSVPGRGDGYETTERTFCYRYRHGGGQVSCCRRTCCCAP